MRSKKWKAAFAALALSVALLAQPLTASAWMLDAEQQQLVDNLTSGQEALLLGNYAQAVNDLSRAVELNSNSVSAYYYRARALQYMGRSTDAAADYSRVAVMTRNGNYGSRYSDAQSLALQLGATSVGTSVFGNVLSGAAAGAQVTGPDGQQRQATAEEAAAVKQVMDAYTQPVLDSAYQQQFADLTDHAGVQEVVNKRTAALTATEETYGTTDKETIYCGSGRTGICIDGSDTIEIEKKAPTASDLVEQVVDELNPLSAWMKDDKPTDHAPRYGKGRLQPVQPLHFHHHRAGDEEERHQQDQDPCAGGHAGQGALQHQRRRERGCELPHLHCEPRRKDPDQHPLRQHRLCGRVTGPKHFKHGRAGTFLWLRPCFSYI